MVVPNFGMVPELLANTDMIAMLPSRCMPEDTSSLAAFPPPIPVAGFPLHIAWHKRRQEDRGVQYVIEQLVRIMMEENRFDRSVVNRLPNRFKRRLPWE